MKNIILSICCLLSMQVGISQQVKKSEGGTFLLKNATIVTVSNGTTHGDLLIADGMIKAIGEVSTPSDAKVIDCTDKFIYPGFIDSGTRLGLSEVGSISLTKDFNEIGDFTPHMKALTAVNPNSVSIPVTRVNGVTTVLTVPSGGRIPGTAALIDLHGYTPVQMYAGYEGVVMNYPSTGRRGRWDKRSDEDIKKDEEKAKKKLKEIWDKATLYAKIDSASNAKNVVKENYLPDMEAMLSVVRGESSLLLEVNKKSDILSALQWIKANNIKAILTGVAEGWRVADSIAQADIPVITGPILGMPSRASDKYDAPYANAGKMLAAGVKVAIRTNEIENVRNLPFNAAFAATYGMGKENALRAITLTPAEIFGVSDMYGSIDVGKKANLFVSDGDPFETKSQVEYLFIEGWNVPIESRHTLLYDEFLKRGPGLE